EAGARSAADGADFRRRRTREFEVRRTDPWPLREDHRPAEGLLQLTDVAGPGVALGERQGIGREPTHWPAMALCVPRDEVPDQQSDVAPPLTKRWHGQDDFGEPVVEISAECPALDR